MSFGMLWFDENKEVDLTKKIGKAVAHYEAAHGQKAKVVFVNPSSMQPAGAKEVTINGIRVKADRTIPAHHVWVANR